MAERVELRPIRDRDAAKIMAAMREAVADLQRLLEQAPPYDRPWHAHVRARLVELNRLYPVRTSRL